MFELPKLFLILILIFITFILLTINKSYFATIFDGKKDSEDYNFYKDCDFKTWKDVTTSRIPKGKFLRKLADRRISGSEGLTDGELRLLSAYLYKDEIVVTTTRQRAKEVGKSIYCRYYDCNRVEIPNSAFKSFLFPMTAVHCARRAGAEFISLSFELSDVAPKPVGFIKRLDEKPPHNLGICVGQIYGPDKKWMNLVEFVEHHKIIGATMFYFTVFQIDEYSRRLLNDYVRTGYGEVTNVETEYNEMYSYAHMIQLNDCFFRARHHSKWVMNIDHDEYLLPNHKNFLGFINSLSYQFAEMIFPMRRIYKSQQSLKIYNNTEEVVNNIQMSKYTKAGTMNFRAAKVLVQPTKVEGIHIHWALGVSPGYRTLTIPKSIAMVNHYREDTGLLGSGRIGGQYTFDVDKNHVELMKARMVETVEYVFKKHNITCDSVPEDWKRLRIGFLKQINVC